MALQYINVSEIDFGRGIDARSAENQIGEGFVKDLLNADVIQKSIHKRTGYESYAGNIPVRALRMEYTNTAGQSEIRFTLDGSISLDGGVYPSPVIVYGKSSRFSSGPFNTLGNSVKYYETYTVPYRKVLRSDLASQAAGYTILGTEHGLDTSTFFCNIAQCASDTGNSYSQIIPNSLTINTNTYNINIGYSIPPIGQDVNIFAYYLKANTGAGNSFTYTWNHAGTGSLTETILPTQHNLVTGNILYRVYQVVGSTWQEVKLDSFLLFASGNGTAVQATINSNTATQYKLILYAAPHANIQEESIAASLSEKKIVLSNVSSPWIFYNLYVKNNINQYEHIEPDTVEYKEDTKELIFTINTPLQITYRLIYQQGMITSNILAVKDNTIVGNDIDNYPQITIWGLDHSEIYAERLAREGWTTHLDTYRRSGERKVVAGLGGNLFIAREGAEFDNSSQQQYNQEYKYPTVYPFLQSLSAGIKQKVGRLFYDTGDTPGRSRGYITSDVGGTGWVSVTSVEYDTNNGWTKYTLSVPNMKIYNSSNVEITNINPTISITSGLEDWLTVNNMSYKRHEGTFKIRQRIKGTHSLQIWVENPDNDSNDWDDLFAGGHAGIFTDQVIWTAQTTDDFNIFIPGDKLFIFQEEFSQVYSSSHSSQTTVCGPLDYITEIVENVVITGQRKSSIIPIRSSVPTITNLYNRDVSNLVQGDMLSYTGIGRLIKIESVNINKNLEVNITSDGNSATVKLTPLYISLGFTIKALSPGHKVLLVDAGNYTGVHTVDTVISGEEFTFKTTLNDSVSGATFIGKTIEIDEELLWADSPYDLNELTVKRRWIPIEAPEDTDDLTPPTYVRHFDSELYWNQPFIRSTMVSDSLYLTNGSDGVMKFDGQNIYRAGLPAWQPGLFTTLSANPATRTCSVSSGSTTITVTGGGTTAGIELGVTVSGTHIPSGTTVVSITDATQFVISLPAVGGGTSDISFTVSKKIVVNLRSLQHKGKPTTDSVNVLELNSVWEDGAIPVGSRVRINGLPTIYTIQSYIEKGGTAYVQFLERLDSAIGTGDGVIQETGTYRYYFRLNAVDANDNIIASAMTSSDDMSVTMSQDAAVRLKLVGMPALDNYNYSRIEIEIYRTKLLTGAVAPVFYKVVTLGSTSTPSVNFDNTTGYLEYVDTAADADLTQLDLVSSIAGAELGIGWSDPLRARYITSADNRLVLGNVKDYPEFDIQIDGQTNLAASVFGGLTPTSQGNTLLFRKDSEDTETDTNMIDRVKFEWKNGFSGTVNSFGVGSNEFSFTTSVDLEAAGTAPGDWIYLTYDTVLTSARDTTYSGWWQIKQISGTSIVVQLIGASAAVSYPNRYVIATDSTDVPVYLGTDGNLGQTSGDDQGSTTEVFDATRRLALALNSVMRMVDIGLMPDFRPWLIARSGNDVTRAGRIVVRAPYGSEVIPSVVPTFSGYSLYVNSLPVETGDNVEAAERVYPSRILVSYQNYPELFDSPTATLDSDSLSAIDINPADGQEITGIIPFFGEAAFTAAQQAGILVVFKTNSIYLVDINQKVSGSNLVIQRLETQGLGCTAPYSIASTKNGIMFANNSGMYCLRRNQAIEYIGKFMERNWGNKVEKEALSIAQGHHYNIGRMYKLSVPIVNTQNETTGYIEPSQVYVYNHTQEDEEQRLGAWSRYDNHNAIGWANLASDAFWASTKGQVYILRTTGTETDYRDSNQPIVFRLDTRPNSYGNSGIRKILDKVIASYRAGSATTGNNLYFSADLEQEYSITSPFRIAGTSENLNNFSDLVQKDIITLRHSLDRRKGVYFSIRIENSNLDENVEVAGLDYRIGGLDSKGIKSADKT